MHSDSNYLSPAEVHALTGLSIATVRRRISDGTLPVVQLGGKKHRILIPRTALDQLNTHASTPVDSSAESTPTPPVNAPLAGPRPKWMRSRADS